MRPRRRLGVWAVSAMMGPILATGLALDADAAPPAKSAPSASKQTGVKPAAERRVQLGAGVGETTPKRRETRSQGGIRPQVQATKLPPALRQALAKKLERRVETNIRKIRELRSEAIRLLSTFVKESPKDSPEMPEALIRLGELKWEYEREAYIKRFSDWEKQPPATRGPAPEPNYAESRALFARAIDDYPDFGDMDLALYVDGFLAAEQGKDDEAQARFDRILREYPQSRFVPDAHMARAEALFAKPDFAAALAEYERVLRYKKSDLYGLALFKSAWCHWRLGHNREATKLFIAVFEATDTKDKRVAASKRKQLDELQSEALKYLVEVFTEDERNNAQEMYKFLRGMGGERFAGQIVAKLAVTFFDQAQYQRSNEAYALLIKLDPASEKAPDHALAIARGYEQMGNTRRQAQAYELALKDYGHGSSWARAQADPKAAGRASASIEKQLRGDALALHARAQRDRTSRQEFEGAAALYRVHLAGFPKSKVAHQMAFNLAEVEFYHLENDRGAAKHYLVAARKMPDAEAQKEPGKSMRHDALYNAIAALERVRWRELEERKKNPKKAGETETDKQFAEALALYAQLYPSDPALPELLFRQGRLYYDYGVYDSAVKIWGQLVERYPTSPYAADAGELLLDSFNRSKNYENIEAWARRLKQVPAFRAPDKAKKLDTLIVQAVFKQGEQRMAQGDAQGAARAYLRAAKEFPSDARAAQACVNAQLAAKKAADVGTLREASTLVTSGAYLSRPESAEGAWIAATSFQSMGLYDEAATFAESMHRRDTSSLAHFKKHPHAKDAAYNAVLLREATGDYPRAISDGDTFLKTYPKSAEADDVIFYMGRAHQKAGHADKAVSLYKHALPRVKNLNHRAQGYVLLAKAQMSSGDHRGAEGSLRTAVQIGKRHGRELSADGRYAAAEARFLQGDLVLKQFEDVKIQGDVKQLSTRLKKKSQLLKQAATIYLDTVSLGVAEWSTAALFKIGYTYETFAKSLHDAPPPEGLSEADREAYTMQIDEFVVPIEERSLDAYENGWKKAMELGIYNRWTAKMRDALGRLNDVLYPPMREIGFDVRTTGPGPFPQLFDSPRRGKQPERIGKKAAPAAAKRETGTSSGTPKTGAKR